MSALGGVLAPACAARCRTRAVRRPLRVAAVRVEKDEEEQEVTYGNGWYDATRNAAKRDRVTSTRTKLAEYRSANDRANNGKERKDLYSDNWDGDEYKGSSFNVASLVVFLFFAVPIAGLAFAYWSYGELWG